MSAVRPKDMDTRAAELAIIAEAPSATRRVTGMPKTSKGPDARGQEHQDGNINAGDSSDSASLS